MTTRIPTLLAAAALLGIGAMPGGARAQDTTIDNRWLAFVGCWEQVGPVKTQVCLVPVAGTSAVDLVKIENGEVVTGERIAATGERIPTGHGDCTGWQSAAWSSVGDRLYLRSEDTCPSSGTRSGTGMIAMTRDGQWLYIQGATVGLATGVRVQRYHEAAVESTIPSEIKDALRYDMVATMQARAAAAAPLSVEDVVDASRHVDPAIVETWLIERGGSLAVNAKQLVALANAKVPSRTIDLLVALSYPGVFAVNGATRQGERLPAQRLEGGQGQPSYAFGGLFPDCSYDYLLYGFSSPSSYCEGVGYYRYAYPYGYGYGFYPGDIGIVYTGSSGGGGGGSTRPHGRVVNGQGYQEGAGATGDVTRYGEPRSSTSTVSSGAAAAPSSTPSSSSSGSTEQRTAKPRP